MEYTTPLETETRFGGQASLLKNPMLDDEPGLYFLWRFLNIRDPTIPNNSSLLGKTPLSDNMGNISILRRPASTFASISGAHVV
jgi:hypothetical protein